MAARELSKTPYPPIRAECPVQPYGTSDESHRRLQATPDITWGYEDDRQPDPLKATRDFVIECKRVRTRTVAGWVFTIHYVYDGMCRFRDVAKRYAEGVACAVMVGYVQDSETEILLAEVEAQAIQAGFPKFRRSGGKKTGVILEFNQLFDRTFPVEEFRLEHRWVDLRQRKRKKGPQ